MSGFFPSFHNWCTLLGREKGQLTLCCFRNLEIFFPWASITLKKCGETGLESTTGNLMRPNLLGWSPVHLFFTFLIPGEKADFKDDDAAFWGKSCFCFHLLFECNCSLIGPCTVQRVVSAAFPCGIRLWNVSFSVCNYSKPYLNSIKEHTILIVIALMKSLPLPQSHCLCFFHELASVIKSQYCWLLETPQVSWFQVISWLSFVKDFLVSPAMCEQSEFCIGIFLWMRICVLQCILH